MVGHLANMHEKRPNGQQLFLALSNLNLNNRAMNFELQGFQKFDAGSSLCGILCHDAIQRVFL